MPTSYTATIKDGITFEQFALRCARAFIPLVTMRDEPLDATISEVLRPSEFHANECLKCAEDIERIERMTEAEADAASVREVEAESDRAYKFIDDAGDLRFEYEEMIRQAKYWRPPTKDHEQLQVFMLQQLDESIRYDCGTSYYDKALLAKPLPGLEWKAKTLARLRENAARHADEHAKEICVFLKRDEWVDALRKSLKQKVTP
jgi:hypothetical protein